MAQQATASGSSESAGSDTRQALADLHEQGRVTLELLRSLITMLMPKEGAGDAPTLDELMARITAQLTQLILLTKLTQSDLDRLGKTLPDAVADAMQGARVLAS